MIELDSSGSSSGSCSDQESSLEEITFKPEEVTHAARVKKLFEEYRAAKLLNDRNAYTASDCIDLSLNCAGNTGCCTLL